MISANEIVALSSETKRDGNSPGTWNPRRGEPRKRTAEGDEWDGQVDDDEAAQPRAGGSAVPPCVIVTAAPSGPSAQRSLPLTLGGEIGDDPVALEDPAAQPFPGGRPRRRGLGAMRRPVEHREV